MRYRGEVVPNFMGSRGDQDISVQQFKAGIFADRAKSTNLPRVKEKEGTPLTMSTMTNGD
jgi:hypothetical protein